MKQNAVGTLRGDINSHKENNISGRREMGMGGGGGQ